MDILILGGTGNISSEVARLLADRGHRVTIATRARRAVPSGYPHIRTDRHDEKALADSLQRYRGDVALDFLGYTVRDCEVAQAALNGKISQYIFISTTAVYQRPSTVFPLTEDAPRGGPSSEYAKKKIRCEDFLTGLKDSEFAVTIVRPAMTFGKTNIPSALCGSDYTLAARIEAGKPVFLHDDGQSLWSMTASSDFAAGLAGLVGVENTYGETYHITTDQVLTWNAIYNEIGLAVGRLPRIVHIPTDFLVRIHPVARKGLPGDLAEHCVFDNSKIKTFVPEFECRKSFRCAVRESVAWFNEDESRKRINPDTDRLIDTCIQSWQRSGS